MDLKTALVAGIREGNGLTKLGATNKLVRQGASKAAAEAAIKAAIADKSVTELPNGQLSA